jgi:replicative DNA helicase
VEAEQSVLGGLMLDNHAWDKVADILTEDDFYRQDHRLIYRHICKLVEHSKPADVVTVAESLELSAELENAGGLPYIGIMAQNTPSAANIRRYAEIVRERSIMRRLAQVGSGISDSAYSPAGRTAADLLDEAEAKVFEIAEAGSRGKQGFIDIQPLLKQVVERIETLYNQDNPSDVTGIATGFPDLDQKTSGFQPGDLAITLVDPPWVKLHFIEHSRTRGVDITCRLRCSAWKWVEHSWPCAAGSVGRLDQHKVRTGRLQDEIGQVATCTASLAMRLFLR